MINDNDITSGKSMFDKVMNLTPLSNIDGDISNVWKTVVSKIGKNRNSSEDENNCEVSIGERMALNSHVVDLKNGILLVETNHSGWIQYLKMYQGFIIKGLKWALPNLVIQNLAFRLEGSNARISDSYEEAYKKAKREMDKKIEIQEKEVIKKFGDAKKSEINDELPPEFYAMFDKLSKSAEENND